MILKVLGATSLTLAWLSFVKWSLTSAAIMVMLFPLMLLAAWGFLLPILGVLWFWGCCYAGVSRMERKRKKWLEALLISPIILAALPLVIQVAAFAVVAGVCLLPPGAVVGAA